MQKLFDVANTWKYLLKSNLVSSNDTSVFLYHFPTLLNRLKSIQEAFPTNASHAVAIKANPLIPILTFIKDQGFLAEAASIGEIETAIKAGFNPSQIVFDSPVKTSDEIEYINENYKGMRVNADSISELKRHLKIGRNELKLGLRINPESSVDTVSYLNVSGKYSKFGESISNREAIITACRELDSLDCLHIHQGSQISNLNQSAIAIQEILRLAEEINQKSAFKKIKFIDIGGGMPVNYTGKDWYDIAEYSNQLTELCPALYNGTFKIITEFGRYTHAHAGTIATKVEYVKNRGDKDIILCHSGADIFLRECYNPGHWPHDIIVLTKEGVIKKSNIKKYDIGGPLCFSGDFPAFDMALPEVDEGDWLIFKDCGANTIALWSKHCSREMPKVIGIDTNEYFKILKPRESLQTVVGFWQ